MMRTIVLAAIVAAAPPVRIPIDGVSVHAGAAVDAAAWAKLSHVSVSAVDHDGHTSVYEGVRLADVIDDAGAPVGDHVRGPAARTFVLVSAQDGYTAVFALGELDTSEARCAPLLAEARDGAPLTAPAGPVQVIAPCDRTHARWVRGVNRLSLVGAQPPSVAPGPLPSP